VIIEIINAPKSLIGYDYQVSICVTIFERNPEISEFGKTSAGILSFFPKQKLRISNRIIHIISKFE
jgi:hypothetical protein